MLEGQLLIEFGDDKATKREAKDATIQRRFLAFHEENPHVYAELVRMAREALPKAGGKLGIRMLWERLRWSMLQTHGDDFKLNDNFPSRYARMMMDQEPDLAGVFELRGLRA